MARTAAPRTAENKDTTETASTRDKLSAASPPLKTAKKRAITSTPMNNRNKTGRFEGGLDVEEMDEDYGDSVESQTIGGRPRLSKSNKQLFEMMRALMDEKFDALGGQLEDIKSEVSHNSREIANLGAGVARNRADVEKVNAQISDLKRSGGVDEGRIEKIVERVLEKKADPGLGREMDKLSMEVQLLKGSRNDARPDTSEDEAQCWFARRGIRCWPVAGTSENELRTAVDSFFREKLRVPSSNFSQRDIEEIRRIIPRSRPERQRDGGANAIKDEVLVVLREVQTRDMLFRHASNLSAWRDDRNPNSIGVRLQIPTHLSGRFNTLNQHGFSLRRKYGPGLKRHIRFEDGDLDFVMDVKLPDGDEWMQVDFEFAREETKAERRTKTARGRISSLRLNNAEGDSVAGPEAPRSAPPSLGALTTARRDADGVFQWTKK